MLEAMHPEKTARRVIPSMSGLFARGPDHDALEGYLQPEAFHGYLEAGRPAGPSPWEHVSAPSICQYPSEFFGIWDASGSRTSCLLQQRGLARGPSVYCAPKKSRRRIATLAQRRAANIRERRRMFNLNEAFDKLRRKVPTFAYEKRLSRIETLRLAITYISFMTEILHPDKVAHARAHAIDEAASFHQYRFHVPPRSFPVRPAH